jgi:putative addiction module component (TIGR02574 family)
MDLPAEERAKLAHQLLCSLDDGTDPDAEIAWTAEIRRRLDDARGHPERLLSLDEVKRRMALRRAERRIAR